MKIRIISLIAFLLSGTLAAQSQTVSDAKPFHFSSRGTGFGVQGEFFGAYIVGDDSIQVNVTKATIYVSEHCPYQGQRGINQLRFGLAKEVNPDGGWKIETAAPPTLLGIVMRPKDERTFYGLYFVIPKKSGIDLTKRWFVVEIQEGDFDVSAGQSAFSTGYAFAHSCKDIFSWTDKESGEEKPLKAGSGPHTCH